MGNSPFKIVSSPSPHLWVLVFGHEYWVSFLARAPVCACALKSLPLPRLKVHLGWYLILGLLAFPSLVLEISGLYDLLPLSYGMAGLWRYYRDTGVLWLQAAASRPRGAFASLLGYSTPFWQLLQK